MYNTSTRLWLRDELPRGRCGGDGGAKVAQLDLGARFVDQQIFEFEVTVDQRWLGIVQRMDCVDHLDKNPGKKITR